MKNKDFLCIILNKFKEEDDIYHNYYEYDEKDKTSNTSIPTKKTNVKTLGLDFKIGDIFVSSDNFIPKYNNNYFLLLDKISVFLVISFLHFLCL